MRNKFYIRSAYLCNSIANVKITSIDKSGKSLDQHFSDTKGYFELQELESLDHIILEKDGFNKKKVQLNGGLPAVIRLLEDTLIGYQNRMSFKPGETIKACINSSSEFQAVLIRHGKNNSVIKEVGKFPPIIQQVPDDFFVENGIELERFF